MPLCNRADGLAEARTAATKRAHYQKCLCKCLRGSWQGVQSPKLPMVRQLTESPRADLTAWHTHAAPRWYTAEALLKQQQQPGAPLPPWVTHVVAGVSPGENSNQPQPQAAAAHGVAALGAAAAASAGPSSGLLLDPSAPSVEEARWRDHQAGLRNAGCAPAGAPPLAPPLAQLQSAASTGPAGSPGAFGAALQLGSFGAGVSGPAAPGLAAAASVPSGLGGASVWGSPAGTALGWEAGAAGQDMDEGAEQAGCEGLFACMYATAQASVASPEEMRVVQQASYATGQQVQPYWLLGAGA